MLNQTIYNLARQADTLARVLEPDLRETVRYNRIRDEKFAELIVRECANQCDLLLDNKISSEWARGTHDCSKAIKKHFGVEE